MQKLLGGVVLIAMASPANAQGPRVPVLISNAEPMACSTARMMHLQGRDRILAVRAGPSRRERELARLREGDEVYACGRRGNWRHRLRRARPGPRLRRAPKLGRRRALSRPLPLRLGPLQSYRPLCRLDQPLSQTPARDDVKFVPRHGHRRPRSTSHPSLKRADAGARAGGESLVSCQ